MEPLLTQGHRWQVHMESGLQHRQQIEYTHNVRSTFTSEHQAGKWH